MKDLLRTAMAWVYTLDHERFMRVLNLLEEEELLVLKAVLEETGDQERLNDCLSILEEYWPSLR